MTVDSVTENILKGIIVAHSRTGITLQELANEYYKCSGERMPFERQGDAIGFLKKFPYILSLKNHRDDTIWYVRGKTFSTNAPCGQIIRCKNNRSPHKRSIMTRSTSTRAINATETSNKHRHYNGGHSADTTIIRRAGSHDQSDQEKSCGSDGRYSYRSSPKTPAAIHNYDLLGDDFFMEMAKIDLNRPFTVRNGISQIGLCVSGQTIRDALSRLHNYPNVDRMKLIINIGSVDILHGTGLSDMCNDFINLVRLCERRNIYIVITTLAPLGNRLHVKEEVERLKKFNQFLISTFASKHQVVDVTKCMLDPTQNAVYMGCYQPCPKFMSGSNQPHLLWNRIGRQRIFKLIKENLSYISI